MQPGDCVDEVATGLLVDERQVLVWSVERRLAERPVIRPACASWIPKATNCWPSAKISTLHRAIFAKGRSVRARYRRRGQRPTRNNATPRRASTSNAA